MSNRNKNQPTKKKLFKDYDKFVIIQKNNI